MPKTKPFRWSGSFALTVILMLGVLWVMGPVSRAHAGTTIPVTTNSDIQANDGSCSLREAIVAANTDTASGPSAGECPAGDGSDTITVPAMEISLTSRLEINSPIEVVGSGVQSTAVDGVPGDSGDSGSGVFMVAADQVTLRGLTIRRGGGFSGGGVFITTGSTVEISDARIVNNDTLSEGGGLEVLSGATVTVRRTTIAGNRSAQGGGISNRGMLFVHESLIGGDPPPPGDLRGPMTGNVSTRFGGILNASSGILNLRNTTVSGNVPTSGSSAATGGVTNFGFAFLNNVTITRNTGVGSTNRTGGLSSASGATTVVTNSIIAKNQGSEGATNDCNGTLTTDSVYNLIGDTTGCQLPPREQPPNPDTFILNVDPKLGELASNGGPTRTHLPASDSPAIDNGFPFPPGGPAAGSCEPTDQRGVPRLLCDIGAVELEVQVPTALSVTTTADEVDKKLGDGTCATASDACSLRAAVQEANRLPGSQTIPVPAGIYDLSIPPEDEDGFDPAAGGDLDLTDSVIVAGADRATVIVDGNDLSRIFDVAPGATATISGMTIRDGTDLGGGGVRLLTGSLTLDHMIVEDNESQFVGGGIEVSGLDSVFEIRDSIVRNNRAPFFGGTGGGIDATGQITINRTRIVRNQASGSGGGLRGSGVVSVMKSTIADNKAMDFLANGGGISASGLNLMESTVSGNTADEQGGGVFASGSIVNSTVSGNTSGTRGGGVSTSSTLTLLHVTIAENKAAEGGNGLFRFGSGSELSLRNTILADEPGTECAGLPPASRGNNIASDASCGLTARGDKQTTDARLNPLADNGGPTLTHLPKVGSPAIDAAADVGLLRDQRGVRRPQGPRPDIGSVERN